MNININDISVEKLWEKIYNDISKSEEFPSSEIKIYFQGIKPVSLDQEGTVLVLEVSSTSRKSVIMKKYINVLKQISHSNYPSIENVIVLSSDELKLKDDFLPVKKQKEEKIADINIPNESIFNSLYTFDNFVLGNSNHFAFKALQFMATEFEKNSPYKIIVITANSGLGKTHLLHALGNYISKHYKNKKILYTTTENYCQDYINSLHSSEKNEINKFNKKYRNLDLLMIDDFQFIKDKTSSLESIFHTINNIITKGNRIVFCADKEIDSFIKEERFLSRLKSGLNLKIDPPNEETRFDILVKKTQLNNFIISEEILKYIAHNYDCNIRELEGILNSVYFYFVLNNIPKPYNSLDIAKRAINKFFVDKNKELTKEKIVKVVADYFNITTEDILGHSRENKFVFPRHIAFYLVDNLLSLTKSSIASFFGGRDHTTVLSAIKKIEKYKINNTNNINDILKTIFINLNI